MSELIKTQDRYADIRGKLLATASCLALLACASHAAYADDETDRPTVWLELGGQLERTSDTQDSFAPPFLLKTPPSFETVSPLRAERPPLYSIGGDAKFSFQPEDTNWVFAASVRYGRANGNKVVHQQTTFPPISFSSTFSITPYDDNYADTKVTHQQSHAVVDFQAGKDFGLGMFGRGGSSVFSLGVRFAQFMSKTTVNIRERPDLHTKNSLKYFHSYGLTGHSARNFHGVGPSLSWDASMPVMGNPQTTEFTFDWGVNAAILFGRQKASVSHHTSGRYIEVKYYHFPPPPYENTKARSETHAVTVPNLGGFVGASVKFPNAKVSLGYRADFFFGAVDGGIDSRVSKTLGFNGPFASISVGFGG
ncbi:MAG TPA: hypothetical protein VIJ62_07180 [Rhizomicrobium sp.]